MATERQINVKVPAEHRDLVEKIKEDKEKFVAEKRKKDEEIEKEKVNKLVNEAVIEGKPGDGTTGGEPQDEETKKRRNFIKGVCMIVSASLQNIYLEK